MSGSFTKIFHFLFSGILILGLGAIVFGQFKAGLQGVILDSNGAGVPGATVTLTNKETRRSQQAITNEEGFYRFSALPPAEYSVIVEKSGFKKSSVESIKVFAEQIEGLNVSLETGQINETVNISDEDVPKLETEDANIRKTITTLEVQRLPQSNRDPYELARLAPGVFGDGARTGSGAASNLPNTSGPGGSDIGIFATENRPAISANGQRVSANSFQIDGVNVNSQTWGGAAIITPTQESVKEIQITSSTYSAEDGRNSGAQIKVVSQNGTNQFHGSGFFKYNDPKWNAFNSGFTIRDTRFTPTRVRTVAPQRVENRDRIYGGSFGGPIIKDRLFFFFAYEGLKRGTNNPVEGFVETPQFIQYIVNNRPTSIARQIVTAQGSDPRVIRVLNPACSNFNWTSAGGQCNLLAGGYDIGSPAGTLGQYVSNTNNATHIGGGLDGIPDVQYVLLENPSSTRGNQYVTRFDYDMTKNDKLAFTLFYTPRLSTGNDTGAKSRPNTSIRSERLNYNYAFSYIRTISPNIINEARFNFTKWGFNEVDSNPDINWGIPRVEVEQWLPTGRLIWGANRGANTPGTFDERTIHVKDVLTWIKGNHVVKFGGEYIKETNINPGTGAQRPVFTFIGWNFVNDAPLFEAITADFTGQPRAVGADFETGGLAFFVQDDWKFRPNLTFNLGLRWEYYKPFKADNLGVLQLGTNGLADAKINTGESLTRPDYNNFGPQIGFAWNPKMLNSKLVIRGGFGIGYDRLPNALPANARRNPPNGFNFSINNCGTSQPALCNGQILYTLGTSNSVDSFPRNPNLGGGFAANGGPNVGTVEIYGLDPEMRTPMIFRYSAEAQYELPWKIVGTLGYQGSRSENFVRIDPLHRLVAPLAANFTPVFWGKGDVYGYYNGMNARLQRRFSEGLQVDFNYKFSKSMDSVSFEAPCACTNQSYPIDQSTEFGRSDYDVRHFFTLVGIWDVPFYRTQKTWAGKILGGWQVNGILTNHSGFPWNPVVQVNNTFTDAAGLPWNIAARPFAYNGAAPLKNTNENFFSAGGLFPGSTILNAGGTALVSCTAGTGCNNLFDTSPNGTSLAGNPPGVGRNVFTGPRYFNVDMSLSKRFGVPNLGVLGENPNLDIRFNFFNIFNVTNIAPFGANSGPTQLQNSTFSEASSLLSGRVIEMQIRFSF